MHALRLPVRAARRPQGGPFSINWDSPQSQDLHRWWPLARNDGKGNGLRLTEMVTGATMKANANDTPKMLFGGGAAYGIPSIEPPFPGWYLEPNTVGFTTTLPQRALAPPFTLMMWCFPDTTAARSTLWHKTGSNGGFRIGTNYTGNFQFTIGTVAAYDFSGCSYTNTAWHFWAVAVQSWASIARGYRFNLSTGSFAKGTASIGTDTATPDAWCLGATSFTDHPLADCRVYRRALTEAEIRRHVEPQTRWDLYWQPKRRLYFIPSGGTEGAGSSAGAGTATAVGASTAAASAASAGAGTAAAVGASTAAAAGASAGVGAATGVGASTAASVGSAAGSATVSGVGQALSTSGAGAAAGVATVSGVGQAVQPEAPAAAEPIYQGGAGIVHPEKPKRARKRRLKVAKVELPADEAVLKQDEVIEAKIEAALEPEPAPVRVLTIDEIDAIDMADVLDLIASLRRAA